jgi:hypothetical protein
MPGTFDPEDLVSAYQAGSSMLTLTDRFGLIRRHVKVILEDRGLEIRDGAPSRRMADKRMIDAYKSGQGIYAVAEIRRWSYGKTRRALLNAGVQLRPPGGTN